MNEEAEEEEKKASKLTETGGLSDDEIIKYVKMSPSRNRSLSKRSHSRMFIVETKPPRRRRSRRLLVPSDIEYYIDPQNIRNRDEIYDSNYNDDYDDENDDYYENEYGYISPRSESNYKTVTPRPPPDSLSRNRSYIPSNLSGRMSRLIPQNSTLTEPNQRQRNLMRFQNAMMKNPVNKFNHRREMEEVDYRDPPTSNKPVIRGGAVVYR